MKHEWMVIICMGTTSHNSVNDFHRAAAEGEDGVDDGEEEIDDESACWVVIAGGTEATSTAEDGVADDDEIL